MNRRSLERPEDIVGAFVTAWNARDPDAIAALFDEDAEFVNVTGLWWHTREEIRKAHAYGLTRIFNESFLQTIDIRIKRLSDETAVVHACMVLSGQSPIGKVSAPRPRSTVMSFVVRKTTAGWLCASAHNTDIAPGSETNVIDECGRLRPVSYRDRS
ncbi:MAG TPA: SgcJ/EcaC family oxidoreductase [Acidobacteriota bacterium]|nr:SgcJ/EcaC family oxidoreductase [Acidobacteriota bacterium]